jgi:hypothetical protein
MAQSMESWYDIGLEGRLYVWGGGYVWLYDQKPGYLLTREVEIAERNEAYRKYREPDWFVAAYEQGGGSWYKSWEHTKYVFDGARR